MKISTKIVLFVMICIISLMFLLSLIINGYQSKLLESFCRNDMKKTAENICDNLNHFLFERIADIRVFSSSNMINNDQVAYNDILNRLLKYKEQYNIYDSISLYDLNRVCLADTRQAETGKKETFDKYWLDPALLKDYTINIYFNSDNKNPMIYITNPVRNIGGKIFRIIVLRIKLSKMFDILNMNREYMYNYSVTADLLDKNGKIFFSNQIYKGVLKEYPHYRRTLLNKLTENKDKNSFFFYENEQNDQNSLFYLMKQPIYMNYKGEGWMIIIHIPVKEIYSPIYKIRKIMIFFTTFFILIACLVAYLLSKSISRPIEKLKEDIQNLSWGEFEDKIKFKTRDEIQMLNESFKVMFNNMKAYEMRLINERKNAESFISSIMDSIIVLNSDGTIRSINKATEDLLGYTKQDLIMEDIEKVLLPGEVKVIMDNISTTGYYKDFNVIYLSGSGESIPVNFSGSKLTDENDNITGFIFLASDIRYLKSLISNLEQFSANLENMVNERTTKLNKMQRGIINILEDLMLAKKDLERSRESFASIVDNSMEGIVVLDEFNRIKYANNPAVRYLNLKDNDFMDEIVDIMFIPDEIIELPFTLRDGYSGINELRCTNTVWNMRKAYLILIRDITERKKAEEVLMGSYKRLQKIDNLKSEFVSTVSHELRTPLAIIKEGLSIILDEITGKINTEQRKVISAAKENIDRLTLLINDLLDISTIESGTIEIRKELTDICILLNKSVNQWKLIAERSGKYLNMNYTKEKIEIFIDPSKFFQIMNNLISNAIKFTNSGDRINIGITNLFDRVEISVSDTGIGIDKDYLPMIFNKFYQVEIQKGPGYHGTGLGLAITKSLIELHSGYIRAESASGKGTVFTFTIPKFSVSEVYREYIESSIRNISGNEEFLNIFLVNINENALKNKSLEIEIIKNLSEIIKNVLKKRSDIAVRGLKDILVILNHSDKKELISDKNEIMTLIQDFINNMSDLNLKAGDFVIKSAMYPQDGFTSEDMMILLGILH